MNKLMVIICDGMDYEFTKNNIESLPNLKKIMQQGTFNKLESVIPADSIPSWSTIYTGMNPCEHGILESIDYLNCKKDIYNHCSCIKGNVFWDKLSDEGKKVLIVNPFMAYPSWEVNGKMISGPVFEGGKISMNGVYIENDGSIPDMGGITDYPNKKQMLNFYNKTMNTTKEQFDYFFRCLENDEYDFAFLGILTLDRMQHFLWKYTDDSDVRFVKNSSLHNSILSAYKLIDKKIGELYSKYGNKYNLMLISDHGHGKRCEKTFFINRFLINNNFIDNKPLKKRIIEFTKHSTLTFLYKIHFVATGTKILKKFKFLHKVKNSDYGEKNIKQKKFYVPNFDGVNPFGGIRVNRDFFDSDEEYNQEISKLIESLYKIKDKDINVVEWVKRREEIYKGIKENIYPEIIFKLNDNYGVDRGLFGKKIIGKSYFHEIISGGHRFSGVYFNSTKKDNIGSVCDIYSHILSYYEVKNNVD